MAANVFVARDPQLSTLLDDIASALAHEGHDVTRGPLPAPGERLRYPAEMRETLFARTDVAIFSGASWCSSDVLDDAPRLRGVVYPAVGVDTLDLDAADRLGVIVGHGAVPENAQGMAEATVMLMLALSYQLHRTERALRDGQPRPSHRDSWVEPLRGRTVGLVGFGRIARQVRALLEPFGVQLLVHHPTLRQDDVGDGITLVSLPALLQASDIVSLHVTLNRSSKGLIGARELGSMKPSAYLVNTSRGEAVDERALVDALERRVIAGAALDTFEVEPLPADSRLRSLPNVILTPHMVGQTRQALAALIPAAVENVTRILAGQLPLHCRNPYAEARWRGRLGAIASGTPNATPA
jgi:D-3-phosphoglycerate dehydrogenase